MSALSLPALLVASCSLCWVPHIAGLTTLDLALSLPVSFFPHKLALVGICFLLDIVPQLLVIPLWLEWGMSPVGFLHHMELFLLIA